MLNTEININQISIPLDIKILGERVLLKELELVSDSTDILIPIDQQKANLKFCKVISIGNLKKEDNIDIEISQTVLLSEYSATQHFEYKKETYFIADYKDILACLVLK